MLRPVSCQRPSAFWNSQYSKKSVVLKAKFNTVCKSKQPRRKTFKNDEMLQDPDFLENLKKCPPPPHYSPSKLTKDWYAGFLQGQANFFTGLMIAEQARYGCYLSKFFSVSMVQSLYILLAFYQFFGYPGQIFCEEIRDQHNYRIWEFQVKGHQDICTKLIPLVNQLPLQGQQKYNYAVLRAISTNMLIRNIATDMRIKNTDCDPFVLFIPIMCIRNRYIQQYVVGSKSKQIVSTTPIIMNAIPKIDLMEASKWRCQIVQVGEKRQFGEDFVVGLVDASGCFGVNFQLCTHCWPVVRVKISLDISNRDYELLQEIQHKFFQGKGKIYLNKVNNPFLRISKCSDVVEVVIPFFLQNPLMSSKYYSFLHFCAIVYKLNFVDKLDNDIIKEIIPIAYKMNSNRMRTSDTRSYTQEQLIEYLDKVPTRQDFVQLNPQLQEIKEDLKQKWKCQKKVVQTKNQLKDV